MRYALILVGAAVVAYFLVLGIRSYLAEREQINKPKGSNRK